MVKYTDTIRTPSYEKCFEGCSSSVFHHAWVCDRATALPLVLVQPSDTKTLTIIKNGQKLAATVCVLIICTCQERSLAGIVDTVVG